MVHVFLFEVNLKNNGPTAPPQSRVDDNRGVALKKDSEKTLKPNRSEVNVQFWRSEFTATTRTIEEEEEEEETTGYDDDKYKPSYY